MTTALDALQKIDLKALLADSGVPVVIGASVMMGIIHIMGRDALANMGIGGVSGKNIFVAVYTADLPGPLPNRTTLLSVDGKPYRLRDSQQEADSNGDVTYLFCEAVESVT